MKTIVAGSRTIKDYRLVEKAIKNSGINVTEIISGHARGVNTYAEEYARRNSVDLVIFPANWNKYGKVAGVIRNGKMAEYADALIAVWDGQSKGTEHMIKTAKNCGLKVFVYTE